MDVLKGKKTYAVAAAAAGVTFLQTAGIIDGLVAQQIYALLGSLGLATLRAGVAAK